MGEIELESIVVRLLGDGSSYQQMMKTAADTTKKTADDVANQGKRIEEFKNKLEGFASSFSTIMGALGVGATLNAALGAWSESETAVIMLNATLKANERNVESLSKEYQNFANEMQTLTTSSDEAVLGLLKQAESFQLTGEAAKQASKDAMALAAINGSSAQSMIRITAAMADGDMKKAMMFSRMIPQLRGVKDETEFMSRYQKLTTAGMETMAAMADTASGRIKQLQNAFNDLGEDLGEIVANIIKPLVEQLISLARWIKELDPNIKQLIVGVSGLILGFTALGPALRVASMLLGPLTLAIKGMWAAMLGPWGLVAAGVLIVVDSLGGFGETWGIVKKLAGQAWDFIKEKALAFWEWIQPIWLALKGIGSGLWQIISDQAALAWELIKNNVMVVWSFVKQFYTWLTGDSKITWEDVRKTVMTVLIAVEFGIRRFGDLWTSMTRKAAIEMLTLQKQMLELFGNQEAVDQVNATLNRLVADQEAAQRRIDETWAQFRDRRFAEIAAELAARQQARAADVDDHRRQVDGQIQKEKDKHDFVLRLSAEALSRMSAYRDTFNNKDDATNGVIAPVAGRGRRAPGGGQEIDRPGGEVRQGGFFFRPPQGGNRPFGPQELVVPPAVRAEMDAIEARVRAEVDARERERNRFRGQLQGEAGLAARENRVDEAQARALAEQLLVQRQIRDGINNINFEGANLQ